MVSILSSLDKPWVILGDFKDLLSPSDEVGGRVLPFHAHDRLTHILNQINIIDIPHNGLPFTWRKNVKGHLNLEKLDRALAHSDWFQQYPNTAFCSEHFSVSDHAPIILDTHSESKLYSHTF